MTGKPGEIQSEIRIATPRSQRQDYDLTEEFLEYKRQITAILDEQKKGNETE